MGVSSLRPITSALKLPRLADVYGSAACQGGTESIVTIAGKRYRLHTFNATGSNLVVTRVGRARVLVVGGGIMGNGGAGGAVFDQEITLPLGTHPVVVGLGTSSQVVGNLSRLGILAHVREAPTSLLGNGGLSAALEGVWSDITGQLLGYGAARGNTAQGAGADGALTPVPRPNSGGGGAYQSGVGATNGADGTVIVRTEI